MNAMGSGFSKKIFLEKKLRLKKEGKGGERQTENGITNDYRPPQHASTLPTIPAISIPPPQSFHISDQNNIPQFHHSNPRNYNPTAEVPQYDQQEPESPLQQLTEEQRKPDDLPEPVLGEIVVALYDFEQRRNTEVSFQQGDSMLVEEEISPDYLLVRHLTTAQKGYIPRAFVNQEWYFGSISRKDAENLLLKDRNEDGAFLVRKAVTAAPFHEYSLSFRFSDSTKSSVQHYRIYRRNGVYYLNKTNSFENFRELIHFHEMGHGGQRMILGTPCARSFPRYDVDSNTKYNWEIDRKYVKLSKKLGSGHFGDVWLGELNNSMKVAVKTLKETKEALKQDTDMAIKAFLEEAAIMKRLKHPHVLPLYGVCSSMLPIYIITEYMDRGSLQDVLREKTVINNLKKRIAVAYQIASGMLYIEEEKLIHRDLAARNVLVNSEFDCKICDFGLAKICQDEYTVHSGNKFPIKWSAPECANYQRYTIKSDVWSFGIVLIEIFTSGRVPYPGMNNQDVLAKVSQGYRMKKPPDCPEDLFSDIVEKCWQEDDFNRPSFFSIVDYLDSYDPSTEFKYH